MVSDDVPKVSTEQRETSDEQPKESLAGGQTEAVSKQDVESDCESRSGDSSDSDTASDNSAHLKVVATAALVGISYEFGPSTITKARLASLENNAHYFLKGYGHPPGVESIPNPRANEAMVFDDFFTAGLRMPLHPVLVNILCKFRVQLHQLTPNAIIQIGKFIWVVTSCGGRPTAMSSLITMNYTTKTRKFILQDVILLSPPNLVVFLFTPLGLEVKRDLPSL
jgi:hypothetical protein